MGSRIGLRDLVGLLSAVQRVLFTLRSAAPKNYVNVCKL